jgi:hypothetical protein
MNFSDVFKDSDEVEQFEKSYQETIKAANELLNDERYIRFRKMYEKAEGELVNLMIDIQADDLPDYALKMVKVTERIKAIRILLRRVESGRAESKE